MKLAVGSRRTQKRWTNRDWTWEEFADRCSRTVRTAETVDEYRHLSKPLQDQVKDVGGFVGGALRQGTRKNGFVLCRSMLTLDLDHAVPGFWDELRLFFDYRCLLYSTHKHTPDSPRVRLIIPLSRDVSPEEFVPVSRMVASDIGLEMMDDTCHEPARLMYWPSTPSDGEFLFRRQDGPLLKPDDILARYPDWHDSSLWPVSHRETEHVRREVARQADPLSKQGPVGAFCRTYDIDAAILNFLPEVYRPSLLEGRYDYIPADSTAGLVTYEHRFAYSHHATDPACGRLLNAFDLVRLHRFGSLDDQAAPDAPTLSLPSYRSMCDFALSDAAVKLTLAREREAQAERDFSDLPAPAAGGAAPASAASAPDAESVPAVPAAASAPDAEAGWQARLELDRGGEVRDTLTNFVEILRHDPRLRGICYNAHRCGIDIRAASALPWTPMKAGWSDSDLASLSAYLDRVYHVFSPPKLKAALLTVTAERSFHPVREFLEALPPWDGAPRLDMLLIDYLGAEDNAYTRAVISRTLIAAVARVYRPGCKFDYIPVLSGPQGIGKSTLLSRLGGPFFSDALTIADMRDKTGPEKLQGNWLVEISEMTGMRKVDAETVKSFASRQDDKYRVAYGSVVESHPRQCVIFGTTNASTGFLRDITGNRRFWPVTVSGSSRLHPWDLDEAAVRQLWAEALSRYRAGEELILKGEEARLALEMQQEALESDDREGLVRQYLDTLLPEDWARLSLSDRRLFLMGDSFTLSAHPASVRRLKVCNQELWSECFGRDPSQIRRQDSYELSAIMSRIEGWRRYDGNASGKLSFGSFYGSQLAYVRTEVQKGE